MLKFHKKNLITAAILFFFLLFLVFLTVGIRSTFLTVSKYPLNLVTCLRREVGAFIFYHRNFTQNERLRKENDLLRQKLNNLNEISLENSRLKDLLSLKQHSSFKVIPARVIARAADSWSSVIIIDKGSRNSIRRGMSVITYLGLAGRVMEVSELTSKVLLLNDPSFSISSIDARSRQEGLVSGTLGPNLIMRYLPEDSDIKVGDTIVSSGLNATYPKGLLIGGVIDVAAEFSGLSLYAVIRPAVKLSNLEEVLIITP